MDDDVRLTELIKNSIPENQLPAFDREAFAAASAARRRRARRRPVLLAAAVVAGGSMIFALVSQTSGPPPTAGPVPATAPATSIPPPAGRPACPGPDINLGSEPRAADRVLSSGTRGARMSIRGTLRSHSFNRVAGGALIVALPGSTASVGELTTELDPQSALWPKNQLHSTPITAGMTNGQPLSLDFTPSTPGDFPVFFVIKHYDAPRCTGIPPTGGYPTTGIAQIGILHVD